MKGKNEKIVSAAQWVGFASGGRGLCLRNAGKADGQPVLADRPGKNA